MKTNINNLKISNSLAKKDSFKNKIKINLTKISIILETKILKKIKKIFP